MGTHPIFESDFDCLTEMDFNLNDFGQPGPNSQPSYSEPIHQSIEYSNPTYTSGEHGGGHVDQVPGSFVRPRFPPPTQSNTTSGGGYPPYHKQTSYPRPMNSHLIR